MYWGENSYSEYRLSGWFRSVIYNLAIMLCAYSVLVIARKCLFEDETSVLHLAVN